MIKKFKIEIKSNHLRNIDFVRIQELAEILFSNFNGGFGFYKHEDHKLREFINASDRKLDISFTANQDYWDLYYIFLNCPINKEKVCSFRIPVENVLFEICKIFELEYSPYTECVLACIAKAKELKLPITEIEEPVVQ